MMDQSRLCDLRSKLLNLLRRGDWEDLLEQIREWRDDGDLFILFPILKDLDHSETRCGINHKNVLHHTMEVLSNLRNLLAAEYQKNGAAHYNPNDNFLVLGTLLHDIGKISTKAFDTEKKTWTYYSHEEVGYEMAKPILAELGLTEQEMALPLTVIKYHYLPARLDSVTDKGLRKLLKNVNPYEREVLLIGRADATSNNPVKLLAAQQKVDQLQLALEEFIERERVRLLVANISNDEICEITGTEDRRLAAGVKRLLKQLVLSNGINNSNEELKNLLKESFT